MEDQLDKRITQTMQLQRLACVQAIHTTNWMIENTFGLADDLYKFFGFPTSYELKENQNGK